MRKSMRCDTEIRAIAYRNEWVRKIEDHAPENMALVRRIALSLLKQERTLKGGVQGKRLKAAMNPGYLLKIVSV